MVTWRLFPQELDYSFSNRGQDILPEAVRHPHFHGLPPAVAVGQLVKEVPLCLLIVSNLDAGNEGLPRTESEKPLASRFLALSLSLSLYDRCHVRT